MRGIVFLKVINTCGSTATSLLLLSLYHSHASAAPIVGGNVTINDGVPESWSLSQQATLTVNGAQTLQITSDNSTLNVNTGSTTQQISASNG